MINYKKAVAGIMSTLMLATSLSVGGIQTQNSNLEVSAATQNNYAEALQKSLYFYDANKCGEEVGEGSLTWRDDCHTYDAEISLSNNTNLSASFISQNSSALDPDGDGKVDLSGGYHDAGDFVKFNLPAAYSAATIAWGMYEFPDAFKETDTEAHAQYILRGFCDYFIKCTFLDDNDNAVAYCYQVGDGGLDHSSWRAPEADTSSSMPRKALFVTANSNPSSDQCYEAAAALASSAVIFKESDPEYSAKLIKYAEALYDLGKKCGSSITYEGVGSFYASDTYKDDKAWSEAWLYLATGEKPYLDAAKNCDEYDGWIHCWGKVMGGYYCLMQSITGDSSWGTKISQNLNSLSNSSTSPQGYYAIGGGWGSARYNSSWQMYALTYANNTNDTSWISKAQKQMDYLLGNNNLGQSYLIGYGSKYPLYPHHRASGQNLTQDSDTSKQKYILWGALVGGPGGDDSYEDRTNDYVKNEVALDYNAAFVGALAGMYEYVGKAQGNAAIDFAENEIKPNYNFNSNSPVVTTPTTEPTTTTVTTITTVSTEPTTTTVSTEPTTTTTNTTTTISNDFKYGDINGDTNINTSDLVMLSRHLVSSITLNDTQLRAADVNKDGKVNTADLVVLSQYLVSKPGVEI